jgi:acetyl esterase
MAWYWKQYIRADEDAENPYAAPIRAETLRGLPAALVITAEYDPLRDEGTAYAKRLSESGVPTTHSDYPGMTHGFFSQWHQIDRGRDAIAEVCSHLRNAFGTQR